MIIKQSYKIGHVITISGNSPSTFPARANNVITNSIIMSHHDHNAVGHLIWVSHNYNTHESSYSHNIIIIIITESSEYHPVHGRNY